MSVKSYTTPAHIRSQMSANRGMMTMAQTRRLHREAAQLAQRPQMPQETQEKMTQQKEETTQEKQEPKSQKYLIESRREESLSDMFPMGQRPKNKLETTICSLNLEKLKRRFELELEDCCEHSDEDIECGASIDCGASRCSHRHGVESHDIRNDEGKNKKLTTVAEVDEGAESDNTIVPDEDVVKTVPRVTVKDASVSCDLFQLDKKERASVGTQALIIMPQVETKSVAVNTIRKEKKLSSGAVKVAEVIFSTYVAYKLYSYLRS